MTSPSGLTVDGVPIPQEIEAAGSEAIAQHLGTAPAAPDSPENPPHADEGAE